MATNPTEILPTLAPLLPRRERLWIAAGKVCQWCSRPTRLSSDHAWDAATVDHIIPRYKGGTNDDKNLVSACNDCNSRRNHEDHSGLPDGSLLGKWKDGKPTRASLSIVSGNPNKATPVRPPSKSLSAVEGLRNQRDQSLNAVKVANERIQSLTDENLALKKSIDALQEEMRSMTPMKLLFRSISVWLANTSVKIGKMG